MSPYREPSETTPVPRARSRWTLPARLALLSLVAVDVALAPWSTLATVVTVDAVAVAVVAGIAAIVALMDGSAPT